MIDRRRFLAGAASFSGALLPTACNAEQPAVQVGQLAQNPAPRPGEVLLDDYFKAGDGSFWDEPYLRFHEEWFGKPVVLQWSNNSYEFKEKNFDNSVLQMWQRCQWAGAHPHGCTLTFKDVGEPCHAIGFLNNNNDGWIANTAIWSMRIVGGGDNIANCLHVDHGLGEVNFLLTNVFIGGFRGDGVWLGQMSPERKSGFPGYHPHAGHRIATPARVLGPGCSIFSCRSAVSIESASETGVTVHHNSGDNFSHYVYDITVGRNNAIEFVGAGKAELGDSRRPERTENFKSIFRLRNLNGGYVNLGSFEALVRMEGISFIEIEGSNHPSVLNRVDWGGLVVRPAHKKSLADMKMKGLVLGGQEIVKIEDLIGFPSEVVRHRLRQQGVLD